MARRIFLSYSREDGAWRDAFRQMLGPALERFGVELWADDHIRSGERWERVIGEGLAEAELGLLLVTPAYLKSSFSWDVEIPALVDAGVPIVWVLVKDCLWEHKALLRERQGLQDPRRDGALGDHLTPGKELARLCRKICDEHLVALGRAPPDRAPGDGSLGESGRPTERIFPLRRGQVFGPVPDQPSAFVARAEEFGRLRAELLEGLSGSVGLVSQASPLGLHGRGGIGKSVLASELTRDPETQAHFPDGVFWLSLGERPDLVGTQRQLASWLGGDPHAIRSPLQGVKVLRDLASTKQCLLVLDDVWSLGTAEAFAVTGPKGRLLLTTRDELLLDRLGAKTVTLDVLSPAAAQDLLARLSGTAASVFPPEADYVLEATGRVALAVALVGAAVGRGNQTWEAVASRLDEAGEVFAGHPYADTFKALEVATSTLGEEDLARYQALACFPEDTAIPPATIGRLWGMPEPALNVHLRRLAELKLARLEKGGLIFHDLERDYLLLNAETTALAHEQLLEVHQAPLGDDWYRLDRNDPYLWGHLTYHLAAAGRHHELVATVADPAWLAVRIARDGTLAAERDVGEGLRWEPGELRLQSLLQRLKQTSHILDRATRHGVVPATLAVHLWPLRERLDLARLLLTGVGHQPAISWIIDRSNITSKLIRTITGHGAQVVAVAWSPDGTMLASGAGQQLDSGSDDSMVRVWDAANGTELRALSGHDLGVNTVAWSPDGTRLASGGRDGTVRVWDAATGTELRVFSGHGAEEPPRGLGHHGLYTVVWSPDGTRLASSAHLDETVRVWDAATGTELQALFGRDFRWSVETVAWSPDGSRLAFGAPLDSAVRVWDAAAGTELRVLSGHKHGANSVAWSPDGTRLASGGHYDENVRVWDAATGVELRVLTGHESGVSSVAWSPDGTRLASSSYLGRTVRIWDAATGAEPCALSGHHGFVMIVAWSPDGTRLASGGSDRTVRVWDASTGTERGLSTGQPRSVSTVAWSPDGTRLASGGGDGTRVWDAATGIELRSGHDLRVRTVAWSPDGTRLASGGGDGTQVWDAATGIELRALARYDLRVSTVAWSPDGTRLAGGSDGTVRVWDVATGAELPALSGHEGWVHTVAWSPDGTRLASGGNDGTVRVWDPATGTEVRALYGNDRYVSIMGWSTVAWSPDGTQLASGGSWTGVRVWDATTGTDRLFGKLAKFVGTVAWSPDGTRLASGGDDGAVRVWDAATGELRRLSGHDAWINTVVWSPDGTRLASGGSDGTLRVWDAATGRHRVSVVAGEVVTALDYSRSTGALAVTADGSVIVYLMPLGTQ